jgi:hypothetical protein
MSLMGDSKLPANIFQAKLSPPLIIKIINPNRHNPHNTSLISSSNHSNRLLQTYRQIIKHRMTTYLQTRATQRLPSMSEPDRLPQHDPRATPGAKVLILLVDRGARKRKKHS